MKMFISLTAVALLLIPALAMPGPMNLFPAGGPILGYDLSLLLADVEFCLDKGIRDDADPTTGPGRSINTDPKGGPVDFGLDKAIHDDPDPVGISNRGKNR